MHVAVFTTRHKQQCTWHKIQDLALMTRYRETQEFCIFCGMIDGLAFLPEVDVFEGFRLLQDICPPEGEDLVAYVDATYINGPYRPAQSRIYFSG